MAKNTALEELIAATEMTGVQFSKASNVKIGTLRNYLAGKRKNPRMVEVKFMAEAAGVSYGTMRAAITGEASAVDDPEQVRPLARDAAAFEVRGHTTLSSLLDCIGYNADDLAFLSGVDIGLIRSLWDDFQWVERATGGVLQAFVGAVPGIDTYLRELAIHSRVAGLAETLSDNGLELRWDTLGVLRAAGSLDQYVVHALQAALHIVQQDAVGARNYLCRFWGQRQDMALGLVFRDGGDGLLQDPALLARAAAALRVELAPDDTAASGIAAANLVHYSAADIDHSDMKTTTRASALVHRSHTMGEIIGSNDVDLSERYCADVAASGALQAIEDWSFPTYSGDCKVTNDFSLPRSILLKHTACEMTREVETYNEAYLHYLVTVGIPCALKRDGTFGGARAELKSAVQGRLDCGLDKTTRKKVSGLLVSL